MLSNLNDGEDFRSMKLVCKRWYSLLHSEQSWKSCRVSFGKRMTFWNSMMESIYFQCMTCTICMNSGSTAKEIRLSFKRNMNYLLTFPVCVLSVTIQTTFYWLCATRFSTEPKSRTMNFSCWNRC